jgi:uncharacterized membrane protein
MLKAQVASGKGKDRPFRAAVLGGLAVVLPPLLTVVIFVWVGATVSDYVIEPVYTGTQDILSWVLRDELHIGDLPEEQRGQATVMHQGRQYTRVNENIYVPDHVYTTVKEHAGKAPMPTTATAVYHRYVQLTYLRPYLFIPFLFVVFVFLLYLVGKLISAGMGRFFWRHFEQGVERVPLVRNVYGAVKQVSDFVLAEREIEYSRVVAIEWPRKGIWTLAMVTGQSMSDIEAAANEPVYSVLVPTSPMPMTGFTITVKKSETIDLNISIDQAIQFIVSCGVVVPIQQVRNGTVYPDGHTSEPSYSSQETDQVEPVPGIPEAEGTDDPPETSRDESPPSETPSRS